MRIFYLVFAVLLLVSLATPGYGQYGYHKGGCPGRCAKSCDKHEVASKTFDCKYMKCCTYPKKG
uniref:Uncharacterized protein n=1 Tax=Chrysemys picta bellii TaxID=8478 RepID=A0A8C3I743_CHRPI